MIKNETLALLEAIENKDKDAIRHMLNAPDAATRYCLVPSSEERGKYFGAGFNIVGELLGVTDDSERVLSNISENTYKEALRDLLALFPGEWELLRPILDRPDILETLIMDPRLCSDREIATVPYQAELLMQIADIFRDPPPHYTQHLPQLLTHCSNPFKSTPTAIYNTLFWGQTPALHHLLELLSPHERMEVLQPHFHQIVTSYFCDRKDGDALFNAVLSVLSPEQLRTLLFQDPYPDTSYMVWPVLVGCSTNSTTIPDEHRLLQVTDILGAEHLVEHATHTSIKGRNAIDGILRHLIVDGDFLTAARWIEAGAYEHLLKSKKDYAYHDTMSGAVKYGANLLDEPLYAVHHLRAKDGTYPKPLPTLEDKKEYLAFLKVMGMARALTNHATSQTADFRALIANTPGTWSEIAEKIKGFTPEDAFTARCHIRDTIAKQMNRIPFGDTFTYEAANYVFEGRTLVDMLTLGHGWNTYPDLNIPLVCEERQAGLEAIIREHRQSKKNPGQFL